MDYKEELLERFSEIVQKKVKDTDTAIVEIVSFKNEIFSDFNGFTKLVQSNLKAETANFDKLYIIIQIKLKEELEKNKDKNSKIKIWEENAAEDYESLLRKEEAEIRQHICIEHQFKLHSENLEQKIMELEDDNYLLAKKIVR